MNGDSPAQIQQKILQKAKDGKPYTLVSEEGDLEFMMNRVPRTTRQSVLRSLPDALIEQMQDQADEDTETDFDISDLEDFDDLSESQPDEFDPDAIMPPETVEAFREMIVEALHHDSLADPEIEELFKWGVPDDIFYATGFLVIAYSADVEGVKRFRTE